jgi:hypothetical protein
MNIPFDELPEGGTTVVEMFLGFHAGAVEGGRWDGSHIQEFQAVSST